MKKTAVLLTGLLLMALASPSVWASSTLRCNSRLISLGDHQSTVLDICGQPKEQNFLGYKEIIQRYHHHYYQSHEVRIDEWVYGPRNGMYHYLRFENARLVKISSSR